MDSFVWFVAGTLFAFVLIYTRKVAIAWRRQRLDRRNAEAMVKIKDAIFNDPFPFGIPFVESDHVPDDTIYVLNTDYLYHDGRPASPSEFVMSPKTKARIQNLKEQ